VDWLRRIERQLTAIEKAKHLGTYGEIDRSKQYEGITDAERDRAINEAWSKLRTCEKRLALKDAEIVELRQQHWRDRVVNIALTSIVTGLAMEGLRVILAVLGF
jgi:hypothetical protein